MDIDYRLYKRKLAIGMFIVAITGTISHFVYDLSGQNKFIGYFFPVNESTWEHMKLAFFPMLILSIVLFDKVRRKCGYNFSLMAGTLTATWLIPFLYYTYKGILGFSRPWLDISTYYASLLFTFFLMLHIAGRTGEKSYKLIFNIALSIVVCQAIAFVIFSYHPLTLGIFS